MSRHGASPGVLRGALLQHAAVTLLMLAVLSAAAAAGSGYLARRDAERTASRVSETLAAAVITQLAAHDFSAGSVGRDDLLTEVAPFIESGAIYRVKLWLVEGDRASIVFSDESAVEGVTRDTDADFQRRLASGAVVAHEVPNDHEHRFELDRGSDLVEVFLGFDDAAGNAMSLEAYVPVDVGGSTLYSIAVLLPLVGGSLLLLAVGLIPLTFVLARRMQHASDERARFALLALTASDRERRELAQRLHDGPIQDLAAAGIMLAAAGARDPAEDVRTPAVRTLLRGSIGQLRSLAEDLAGAETTTANLADAITGVVRQVVPAATRLELVLEPGLRSGEPTTTLLVRAAREMVRNAVRHGQAGTVHIELRREPDGTVMLAVADDGAGFDPAARAKDGHLGLVLLAQALQNDGGRLSITSAPGAGTRAVVTVNPGTTA